MLGADNGQCGMDFGAADRTRKVGSAGADSVTNVRVIPF
ncbi:hypothetical protein BSI_24900 [Bacillus inaquosorum KCTC 13429]|uniref:Uncharacterized protein n=1 Tax=Bacillus inaquosorum KCTC 13429 TaxID=1236548 RepID=A0A9W5LHT6_9BACI|nr:hypothetical protein BSI_24900 [Bacillus inaquosorum KCTC 13429]